MTNISDAIQGARQIVRDYDARTDAITGEQGEAAVEQLREILDALGTIEQGRSRLTNAQALRFGHRAFNIMDADEWSADTIQAIGDYATLVLGVPFLEPDDDDD